MFLKSAKVNEFRLWGLLLTLGGMLLMIIGAAGIAFDWGTAGKIFAGIFLVLGLLSIMASMAVYFWAGMLASSAITLECPECGKMTRVIGKTDRCMFCKTILTFDREKANTLPDEAKSSGRA